MHYILIIAFLYQKLTTTKEKWGKAQSELLPNRVANI